MIPGRWLLFALPAATVAIVALALVTAGVPRPARAALVYGGPTDHGVLAVRAEVVEVIQSTLGDVMEHPVRAGDVRIRVSAGSRESVRSFALDEEGQAEARLELGGQGGPVWLGVEQANEELARARVQLDAKAWRAAARRRGGFVSARAGTVEVRFAPARGALAVPVDEEVWIDVLDNGVPLRDVDVGLASASARIVPPSARTDPGGRARFRFAPEEHAVSATVTLSLGAEPIRVSFGVPVVPGALRATRVDRQLLVESPIPRDVAYYALVTENARLGGGIVRLSPDKRFGASALVPLPVLPDGPVYAVVSSERDLRSAAAVGWPLRIDPSGPPLRSFDAVDALLVDGRPRAMVREAARRTRVRWVTLLLCAVSLIAEIALLVRFTRDRDRELVSSLERSGLDEEAMARVAPARSRYIGIALVTLSIGFLVVALVALLRLR
jgi:hypothetical protein